MAHRAPRWLTSDQLTALGLAAQIAAGAAYVLTRDSRYALLLVNLCIVLNWFGDSMDGTLARARNQQRPRFGFYVDHMVDIFGATALMCGLGLSGLVHWPIAIAMLIGFLLLSGESYLATYTLSRFELSQGIFGPTEIRILLIIGNFALLHSPYATIFGYKWLLFDVGGIIAASLHVRHDHLHHRAPHRAALPRGAIAVNAASCRSTRGGNGRGLGAFTTVRAVRRCLQIAAHLRSLLHLKKPVSST